MKRPSITKPKATSSRAGSAVTLKKILVPTDFSPTSGKALEYAAALATLSNATVILLHIAEVGSPGYEHGARDFPRMERQLRQAAEKQIAESLEAGTTVAIQIGRGWPFGGKRAYHEIVETARSQHADLIVISTHGFSGLDHLIMGSTAERVVRHAPCPVLVVRACEHEFIQPKAAQGGKSRRAR